jgi:hypothetical protein
MRDDIVDRVSDIVRTQAGEQMAREKTNSGSMVLFGEAHREEIFQALIRKFGKPFKDTIWDAAGASITLHDDMVLIQ